MNTLKSIIEFILNYIIVPVFFFVWLISGYVIRFFTDVMKHLYGKILIPLLALSLFGFIIQFLLK